MKRSVAVNGLAARQRVVVALGFSSIPGLVGGVRDAASIFSCRIGPFMTQRVRLVGRG